MGTSAFFRKSVYYPQKYTYRRCAAYIAWIMGRRAAITRHWARLRAGNAQKPSATRKVGRSHAFLRFFGLRVEHGGWKCLRNFQNGQFRQKSKNLSYLYFYTWWRSRTECRRSNRQIFRAHVSLNRWFSKSRFLMRYIGVILRAWRNIATLLTKIIARQRRRLTNAVRFSIMVTGERLWTYFAMCLTIRAVRGITW